MNVAAASHDRLDAEIMPGADRADPDPGRHAGELRPHRRRLAAIRAIDRRAAALETPARDLRALQDRCAAFQRELARLLEQTAALLRRMSSAPEPADRRRLVAAIRESAVRAAAAFGLTPTPEHPLPEHVVRTVDFAQSQFHDHLAALNTVGARVLAGDDPFPQ